MVHDRQDSAANEIKSHLISPTLVLKNLNPQTPLPTNTLTHEHPNPKTP